MTVDVCPSEAGSPWDPGDSVEHQSEQVFVFGPRDDMSDVIVEQQPAPPDEDPPNPHHQGSHLSPILVAPARQNVTEFEFTVTAPTPPVSASSGTSSMTSRTPNETLGTPTTSDLDTSTTLRSTPNGTLRRAQSDRPQYLSPSQRASRRQPRHKTISDVTAEARKVLEQLILRNEGDSVHSHSEGASAPPSALLPTPAPHDLRSGESSMAAEGGGDDEPDFAAPARGGMAAAGAAGMSACRGDAMAMPDDDATSHSPVSAPNSTYSFSSRSSSHRNRIHLMTQITDEAQLKRAAAQQEQRKKKKRKTRRPPRPSSTSSSSSSEYEIVDGQLRLRSKKSIFKRAKERFRQSFRRKKQNRGLSFDPYSIDDEELREAEAQTPKTRDTKRSFRSRLRPQRSSEKSRSSADRSPVGDRGFHSDVTAQNGRCPVHDVTYGERRAENGAAPQPRDAAATTPVEKDKHRGIFDSILRTIRKGSDRLRRRGSHKEPSTVPPRSRSADAITAHATLRRDEDPATSRRQQRRAASNRKSAPQDDTTMPRTGAPYCRCHSADGHVVRPRPPPLPALMSLAPTPANSVNGDVRTSPDRRHLRLQDIAVNTPHVTTGHDVMPQGLVLQAEIEGADELDGLDEVDSKSPGLLVDNGPVVHTPFAQKTEQEKDELFEKIAEQLAAIADNYNLESPRSLKSTDLFRAPPAAKPVPKSASAPLPVAAPTPAQSTLRTSLTVPVAASGGASPSDGTEEDGARGGGRTPIEQKIGRILRDKGDRAAAGDLSDFQPVVSELVRNASYSRFQQIIHENVGTEPGWQQVALVFNLTRSAVQLAGLGTAAALQIKELTLRYFEDRFAGWIVGQGGWESMVEDTDLSSEVD